MEPGGGLCVATWNLQGSEGIDASEVARRLGALAAPDELDVIVLQEVQRRQTRRLASALGVRERRWAFKHWPVARPAEGLAVLSRHRLARSRAVTLQRAAPWSWRRRIALLVEVVTPLGPIVVVDVHLSPHDLGPQRRVEVERLDSALAAFGVGRNAVLAGDLNDPPGGTAHAAFVAVGWRDAWMDVHGPDAPGCTNWTDGPRLARPPTQRLDYLLLPSGWTADRVSVPGPGEAGWDQWAVLSDHLPVVASLRRG